MSLIIWGTVGFLLGLVIYLAVPILVGPMLPDGLQRALSNSYFSQATASMRRTTLLDRINSGHTLVATDFDAEWGDEVATVGGQEYRIEDPKNRMTRMCSRPFGMMSERFCVYVSVRDALAGKYHQRHKERGDNVVTLESEDGQEMMAAQAHMTVPNAVESVSLHSIAGLLGGQASPTLGEEAYDDIEKSQAAFDTRNVIEVMSFVMAFLAVYLGMWFAASQGGAAGGPSVSVPVMLEVLQA